MTESLLDGLVQVLADAGVGLSPDPDEVFPENQWALVKRQLPAYPDRVLALIIYNRTLASSPRLNNRVLYLQVRTRGPSSEVDTKADVVMDLLHLGHHQIWGGTKIERCKHESSASLGADDNGRQERTDNYTIILQGPVPE